MSFEYPDDLQYLDSHEYVRIEGDIATIGITAFAVDQLGDIVFVELPEVGEGLMQLEPLGNVESVKAVEELMSPVCGDVVEVNEDILDQPEQLASDPYGAGWLLKVKVDPLAIDDSAFMSADEYAARVEGDVD